MAKHATLHRGLKRKIICVKILTGSLFESSKAYKATYLGFVIHILLYSYVDAA